MEEADYFDKEWNENFETFWLPLLKTDGKFDLQKIKNEMHDLVFVLNQVAETYCYITGGKLSKAMYYASVIKGEFDNQMNDSYDEGYKDGLEENDGDMISKLKGE